MSELAFEYDGFFVEGDGHPDTQLEQYVLMAAVVGLDLGIVVVIATAIGLLLSIPSFELGVLVGIGLLVAMTWGAMNGE